MAKFKLGDKVKKSKGADWHGFVVGAYSTAFTSEGYAVESYLEHGSVQLYPAHALELVPPEPPPVITERRRLKTSEIRLARVEGQGWILIIEAPQIRPNGDVVQHCSISVNCSDDIAEAIAKLQRAVG